jgi:hypothetical protein
MANDYKVFICRINEGLARCLVDSLLDMFKIEGICFTTALASGGFVGDLDNLRDIFVTGSRNKLPRFVTEQMTWFAVGFCCAMERVNAEK